MADVNRLGLGVLAVIVLAWWCGFCGKKNVTREELLRDVTAPQALVQHSQHELTAPEIIKITDGVYMAFGYALANSILLEGPDGIVIVDTTESLDAAEAIKAEFRRISTKPIKGIIYTHSHPDHTTGSSVFLEGEGEDVQIWSHEKSVESYYHMIFVGQGLRKRSMRQFGVYLTDESRVNSGIGPRLRHSDKQIEWAFPTHVLRQESETIKIAGLTLTLLHIPGETDDQMAVWLPDKKVLLPGDDIYRTFPNLYAIRGTTARNVLQWSESLRTMRDLQAEYLVPSHTKPLIGKEVIYQILNTYGDAVQFVHDQTVRYINKDYHPDTIASLVHLPPSLANHPFLLEFYGTVEWSVKSVYDFYLGWFNGRIDDLLPLPPKDSARRWIRLIGGTERALQEARQALKEDDVRWALKLTSVVLDVEPDSLVAKELRARIIKSIASTWTTANGRNYILTTMLEDFEAISNDQIQRNISHFIRKAPTELLIRLMATRLKAEEVQDVVSSAVFNFTDVNQVYTLSIRNCIMDIQPFEIPGWTVKFSMTTVTWKRLLTRESTSLSAFFSGSIAIEGGVLEARRFLSYFDRDVN